MMDQRVIVVTGTSSGIGRAVAALLATEGWRVIGTRRRAGEPIEGVDARLMDVVSDQSVSDCVTSVLRDYGRIDAVINNAGAGHVATLEDDSLDDIKQVMDVNFFGVVRVTKACLPALRASRGRLVTVTSVGGVVGQPFNDAYCAAKFAVEGMMESLAPVARGAGVKVSVIEPGFVKTEFVSNLRLDAIAVSAPYAEMRRRYLELVATRMPLGQTADEVARVIAGVLADPDPRLRYQTSANATAFVRAKLSDETGGAIQAVTHAWVAGPPDK